VTEQSGPGDGTSGDKPAEPTFAEAFSAALGKAGFAKVKPGQLPTGRDLLAGVGGVRGIVESIVPGFGFLLLYTTTRNLPLSVLVPVALAVVFVLARAVARQRMTTAIAGAIGVALTALLALLTDKPEANFLPGIIINAVSLLVLLLSVAVRWPLIGVFAGFLSGDPTGWRTDAAKRRVLYVATWLWVGLFALRLVIEVPLYLANEVVALGAIKLITGVPLYAAFLWITWLLIGTVFATDPGDEPEADAPRA
jgi:Protein of unknown function (DUF3159)